MERYRFHSDGAVFFVTFTITEWLPVFISEQACRIVTDSLRYCHESKGLRINAYVLMPTHFHGIVFHESFRSAELTAAIKALRKHTGRALCDYCDRHMPPCYSAALRAAARRDRRRHCWQDSRHPVVLETESLWRVKFDYLHENPCRKGLVIRAEHWRFSSARYWFSDDKEVVADVPLCRLHW